MSLYGRIFPAFYDRMSTKSERDGLRAHRQALLADATGDVVEIGGGTGANLEFYGDQVRSLTITEPEEPMIRRMTPRIAERAPQAKLLRAPAEDLPFEDDSFDTAVSTLVLCTVDDQPRALRELRRVLRPGGRLLFMEHVLADAPKVAKLQGRMHWLNSKVGHGCHCNRPTLDTIRAAGFEVERLERDTIPHAPPWIQPLIVGVAASAATAAPTERSGAARVA